MVVVYKQGRTAVVIAVAVPRDRNIGKTEHKKLEIQQEKYPTLTVFPNRDLRSSLQHSMEFWGGASGFADWGDGSPL